MIPSQPIPYGKQSIDEQDLEAVRKILQSDFLTTGPAVQEFEEKFAQKVGAKYAVAVSSGTAALHLACLAAGLSEENELITSPLTFAASANCALYCNAKPVFADINEHGLINPLDVEKKINEKTKVIVPVHYAGLACDLKKLRQITTERNIIVIEDACHALGAKYADTTIGDCTYSDMSVFSFHPVKHITTGEGGMITTNSKELYERLCKLRQHGITKDNNCYENSADGPWYHEMQDLGFNYRLSDIQAGLGLSQLRKLDSFLDRRRAIAERYNKELYSIPEIILLTNEKQQEHAYHLFVILLENEQLRKELFLFLRENNIFCQVHYIPVYWHPYYQRKGFTEGQCPQAEDFYRRCISLPMFPSLTDVEQSSVVERITSFFSTRKLALGTVQFGLDYGINNPSGKIPEEKVRDILTFAHKSGIDTLDTAIVYGESESLLGKYAHPSMGIVTKIGKEELPLLEQSIVRSLHKLQRSTIDACLFHHFDMFMKDSSLLQSLLKMKQEGKVEKIGFSLYEPWEAQYLLDKSIPVDLVQIPYNIFDQRFSAILPHLKAKGIEVHVRSVFLQGLFFKKKEELDPFFRSIAEKIGFLQQFAQGQNIPLSAVCINFALLNEYIDKIVIGVNNLENLKENIQSFRYKQKTKEIYQQLKELSCEDFKMILPINWPQR